MRGVAAALAVVAFALTASAADAQAPEDFTPVGYEFCGWWDGFAESWTFDDPEPGAWMRLFAREMSCKAARRNYARLRYTQTPPYRPVRAGYRCRTLEDDYEYDDMRCAKIRRPRVAFRLQAGA